MNIYFLFDISKTLRNIYALRANIEVCIYNERSSTTWVLDHSPRMLSECNERNFYGMMEVVAIENNNKINEVMNVERNFV